jgi:hypothetical protein
VICVLCGGDHTGKNCHWPTDTEDEPIKVPYIPPIYDDEDLDEYM